MSCNIDDALRSILDSAYSIADDLGLHKYQIFTVQVSNPGGGRPGVGGIRTKTVTPLFIGNMNNPACSRVSSKDIILSNELLNDKDFKIGPFVFPFTTPDCIGGSGLDISFFDPASNTRTNQSNYQLYFLIFGPGLSVEGNYFEKIYTSINGSGSLSYTLFVRNLGITLP